MFPNHFAWNCGWVRATVIRREEEVPLVRFDQKVKRPLSEQSWLL